MTHEMQQLLDRVVKVGQLKAKRSERAAVENLRRLGYVVTEHDGRSLWFEPTRAAYDLRKGEA